MDKKNPAIKLAAKRILRNQAEFKEEIVIINSDSPGSLLALLQEPVGGSHGDQDGPGCPELPSNYQYDQTWQH